MMNAAKQPSNETYLQAREQFFKDGGAAPVFRSRTELVDGVVFSAFEQHLTPVFGPGLAALAVGGYGRAELFPHSDIDVLLLAEEPLEGPAQREALSNFLRQIWDAGLRLSHSVHTPAECTELHAQNPELNVSLLDERFLAGDAGVYNRLREKTPKFLAQERQSLVKHLARLTRSRHEKFHNTIYHLEPNIKETPGGLRDLHLIWWLAKLRDPRMPAEDWLAELDSAKTFLHTLRCFIHFQSSRDNNLLNFDFQEQMAEQPFNTVKNPADWMREYFRNARAIHRVALKALEISEAQGGGLLQSFRDWRSRLSNSEFTISRERLILKSPGQLETDPEISLRVARFIGRHGVSPAPDTEARFAAAMPSLAEYFSQPRQTWNYLQEILRLPHAMRALRFMHDIGLMKAVFPEWGTIECLVQRDFYHRYTVDEHTLITIETLLTLPNQQTPQVKRFAELLTEIEEPPLLIFALLFHDTGKSDAGAGHAAESARVCRAAMGRIRMPEEHRPLVEFLIEQHLALSSVINSRDLDDPATARYLADRIGTIERLKYLTLLTFCDISAVNPTAMTPWRMEQLWRVHAIASHELTVSLDTDRIAAGAESLAPEAGFLDGFPRRYLRTHTQEELQSHLALDRRAREAGIAVDISRAEGVYTMTLITTDRPGIFASIAGALSSFGMNILKAEAFANKRGEILDTFRFADPNRNLELNPTEADRLRLTIEKVVTGRTDVKTLLSNRPKPVAPSRGGRVKPAVFFDSESSAHSTLVEIVAEDRPGLLYDLASTLSAEACNIEVVLIDTEAHKALDVFYITSDGAKLTAEKEKILEQRLLRVCQTAA